MISDQWSKVLEGTHKAVRAYAQTEFDTLTRKVIYRLKRMDASGIYGDDYAYKTLWDEYCHEIQFGPTSLLEFAWEQTLTPFLDDIIEKIPRHSAVLLTIYAAWELDEDMTDASEDMADASDVGAVAPDQIKQVLKDYLGTQAGMSDLQHLDPWRNT